jgi:uncharacterized protein YaeQ
MDRGGSFAMELLIDDAFHQSLKRGLCAGDAESEWARALNQAAKFWIGGGELAAREGRIVAGWTRTVEETRHTLTVSHADRKVFYETK